MSAVTAADTQNELNNATVTTRGTATSPDRLQAEDVRDSVGRIVQASAFASVWSNIAAGVIYTAFARTLGADDRTFGMLAAVANLMCMLQVFTAHLVERSGRRKAQAMIGGMLARGMWMPLALLPVINHYFPALLPKGCILPLLIGGFVLSGLFGAFVSPAYFSWMTDLVPGRVRPTFFARCMQLGTWIALVATLVSSQLADRYPCIWMYSGILFVAGVCGVLSMTLVRGVKEPPQKSAAAKRAAGCATPSFFASLREPLKDAPIRRFMAWACTLTVCYCLQNTFVFLHCMENLKLSKTQTSLVLTVAPLVAIAVSARFWGSLTKRFGNRPVMHLGSIGLALIPLGWLMATPGPSTFLWLMGLLALSGAFAGALDITSCNLITEISPKVPRSTLTALYNMTAGLCGAAAAFLGGELAQWLQGMRLELGGHIFVNYHVLFLASLLMRLINAAFVAPRLYEPEAAGTLATFHEIVPPRAQPLVLRVARPLLARV